MEYKQPPPELSGFVDRAQDFWNNIDVDEMQPVIHAPPETDEQKASRIEMMNKIAQKQKEYEDFVKINEKSQQERIDQF